MYLQLLQLPHLSQPMMYHALILNIPFSSYSFSIVRSHSGLVCATELLLCESGSGTRRYVQSKGTVRRSFSKPKRTFLRSLSKPRAANPSAWNFSTSLTAHTKLADWTVYMVPTRPFSPIPHSNYSWYELQQRRHEIQVQVPSQHAYRWCS